MSDKPACYRARKDSAQFPDIAVWIAKGKEKPAFFLEKY